MTALLERAVAKARALPEEQQDALAAILLDEIQDEAQWDEAERKGAVRIRRRDGREFELLPVERAASPFDVEGAGLDLTAEEIVASVRKVRARETS